MKLILCPPNPEPTSSRVHLWKNQWYLKGLSSRASQFSKLVLRHYYIFFVCVRVCFYWIRKKSSSPIIYFLCEVFKCSGILRSMNPSPSVFMIGELLFIPVRIVSTFVFNFLWLLLFKNCLPRLIKMFRNMRTGII